MQNFGIYRNNSDNIRFSYGYNFAVQESKFCKEHTFSNAVKIMVFISGVQNYIPVTLCKTADSMHLYKNYRHTKSWKHKAKQKLHIGHVRDRLERSHSDF